jgi:hypothetical protein
MSVNWKMIDSTTFIGEKDGYQINIKVGAAFGLAYWNVSKDGHIIDDCWKYSPVRGGDLGAKHFAESVLNKIIKNKQV